MTRFEQIAAAFPLHAQWIAECTAEIWLQHAADALDMQYGAGWVLRRAFNWSMTDEGFEYWNALSDGARQ